MMMHNLSDAIEREAGEVLGLDRNSEDWPAVSQVKEKFGLLRYHCFSVDKSIRKLIDEAEENSKVFCEGCGSHEGHWYKNNVANDKYEADGWWHVYCDKCEAESKSEMKRRAL